VVGQKVGSITSKGRGSVAGGRQHDLVHAALGVDVLAHRLPGGPSPLGWATTDHQDRGVCAPLVVLDVLGIRGSMVFACPLVGV